MSEYDAAFVFMPLTEAQAYFNRKANVNTAKANGYTGAMKRSCNSARNCPTIAGKWVIGRRREQFPDVAFDMSKFSNHGRDVALGIRERYIWELLSPPADDPIFQQLSGQFRAELHDRFMAPVYPFAFAVLTFAFLLK